MLTVEQRAALVEVFEGTQRVSRNRRIAGGIDAVLADVIARENSARIFYQTVNACTDWGVNA